MSVHPNAEDVDVPANTRIWIHESPASLELDGLENECTPHLWASNGDEIPYEFTMLEAPTLAVLTPTQLLEVGARYELDLPCRSSGDGREPIEFTASRGPDLEAPQTPVVQVGEWFEGGADDIRYGRLGITSDEPTVLLDVGLLSEIAGSVDDGTVTDAYWLPDRVPIVGVRTCGLTNWHPDSKDDSVEVRAAAVDFAGNVSAWSEPVTVRVEAGCGCAASGPSAWPGSLLLAVVVASHRRRREPS